MPLFNARGPRTSRSTRRLAAGGALLASLALLATPGAALAGEAGVDSDGLARFDAFVGEDNSVSVAERPGPGSLKTVVFRDVEPISVGAGCVRGLTAFEAECRVSGGTSFIRGSLRNLDDRIEPATADAPSTIGFSVTGDPGDDQLLGTNQRDILDGGDGRDSISARGGNDVVYGYFGNDSLAGGAGLDDIYGGWGDDTLNANDGGPQDFLDCGPGNDLAIYNPGDVVASNCERTQLEL